MEEQTEYVVNPCVCCGEEAPEGQQYCGRCGMTHIKDSDQKEGKKRWLMLPQHSYY